MMIKYPEYVDLKNIKSTDLGYPADKYRFMLYVPFIEDEKPSKGILRVIMKNPSSADEKECDMSLLKLCKAARYSGYNGLIVLNLFPYRSKNAKAVYSSYFLSSDYLQTMKKNMQLIEENCQGSEIVFAWGTNTVSSKKEFREEYDRRIGEVIEIVRACAAFASGVCCKNPDSDYYLHGQRWWESILEDVRCGEDCLASAVSIEIHDVIHHNFFGPSSEVAGLNKAEDFEIFCYLERRVCNPSKCDVCPYYGGDDFGQGRICVWEDFDGNSDPETRIVKHFERFREKQRVDAFDEFEG